MNRGKGRKGGYTVVETMIFLAVSAAMFVSAMTLISGRQQRAEFNSAIREFQSSLEDIANDVSTGYYSNTANSGQRLSCTATGPGAPVLSAGAVDKQGSNKGCIFVGKTLHFGPSDQSNEYYNALTLVGRQWKSGGVTNVDVQSYRDASLVAVAPSTMLHPGYPDATVKSRIGGGVTFGCVFYAKNPVTPLADRPCTTAGTVGVDYVTFLTTFQGLDNQTGLLETGQLKSGSSHVDLLVSSNTGFSVGSRTSKAVADEVDRYATSPVSDNPAPNSGGTPVVNPAGGIYICLQSNGTNQHALVSFGGANSQFSVSTKVDGGKCT